MARTNKHMVLVLRRKVSLMAEEIEGLRIELSKAEEKIMILKSLLETRTSGGNVHE